MMKTKILIILGILLCLGIGVLIYEVKITAPTCPYVCCFGNSYEIKECLPNYFCRDNSCVELKRVSVRGTEFVLGDEPFHFIGAFTFPVLTHQIYEESRKDWRTEIDLYLDSLKYPDVRVIRFFAFGPYDIRISGREEPNWERLDYFIHGCEKRGIYVIFTLWDYYDYTPSEGAVVGELYTFWEDKRIKPAVTKMINRYKNSNAIFAWQIINEGDLATIGDYYPELYNWTKETTNYIKLLDQSHLVSTGFSHETLREAYFNAPSFYQEARNRIIEINRLPDVDFMTFHSYGGPMDLMTDPSWYTTEWENQMKWFVNETTTIRSEVKKPILFEEWGAQRQVGEPTREKVYFFILDILVENNIDNLFNGWGDEKELQSMLIYTYDAPEVELIKSNAKKLKRVG